MTARGGFIAALHALADLLAANPDLPLPSTMHSDTFEWNVWAHETDDVPAEVARLRRLLPPVVWTKNNPADGDYAAKYYVLTAPWLGVTLEIGTCRELVCERVVTGTREVTEDVPVAFETVTKTVEDVEWICRPVLADEVSS